MFDAKQLLQQLVGGGMGGRSRLMPNKATIGLSLLGIGIAAFEHYKSQSATQAAAGAQQLDAPPPPPPGFLPTPMAAPSQTIPSAPPSDEEGLLLVRAMIAAAWADGSLDASERQRILDAARQSGMDGEGMGILQQELFEPWDLPRLVSATPLASAEKVYVAARMAVVVDTDAEQAFLDQLALGLQLAPPRRAEIDAQLG